MDIQQLAKYLDDLLDLSSIKDAPNAVNGLQVERQGPVKKIGLAVDACLATLNMAKARECDMLFVHHGLLWGGNQPIRGKHFEKIALLIQSNIGLYSAHLPLDMHPVLGNNRALADLIGLQNIEPFGEYSGIKIGLKGEIESRSSLQLARELEEKLNTSVKCARQGEVKTVGIVSGGAGDILNQAIAENLDCYITGEGGNHNFHEAEEGNCSLLFAGHYATETGGVRAVGKHLKEKFNLQIEFLHYPTGL
ncbi:MAG: Nif3-like dinuclear metal center hexameric protein [Nitrospinae bacterium CG11_big_fil_rev_8_21_14_0_20_45_15]|nr:MAG: Nif3-like dinuclear metal center hexameric protein [Nitrospinae bacterium CG11_big_fil_rev_8_21_14_0_20_45_15]